MSIFGIIADDFTGANDTGIQFAKHGCSTITLLDSDDFQMELINDTEVVVVNTETRNSNSRDAYQKVEKASHTLINMGIPFIYKKVDSLMRGHPGIELLSVMRAKKVSVGVITPAFPANSRMVAGGFLFVNDDSLKHRYGKGVNLVELVGDQAGCNICLLSLEEVRKGIGNIKDFLLKLINMGEETIVIADAVCQEDLAATAGAVNMLMPGLVAAGSGGLAEELLLASNLLKSERNKTIVPAPSEGILIVIGSYSPVTAKQIEWLESKELAAVITMDVSKLVSPECSDEIKRVIDMVQSNMSSVKYTAVVLNSLFKPGDKTVFDDPENSGERNMILEALGQISSRIVTENAVRALILSGGDTASFICKKLGCKGIKLEDEIVPGIPVGRFVGGRFDGIYAVTKSGGFGSPDALDKVLQYIGRRNAG